jgi:hypothetical protein
MEGTQRVWAGRWLEPINDATVAELLVLRDLRRSDVTGPTPADHPDPKYLNREELHALELLADHRTVPAGELIDLLGSQEVYWQLRSIFEKFHYAVDWPDHPDRDRPMRIEGRVLPGVPRTLWDQLSWYSSPFHGPVVDIVGTVIEIVPLDARPEVLHLIVELAGLPHDQFPSYNEALTGDWAEWVETNRALSEPAYTNTD